jgi:hypothetical protein
MKLLRIIGRIASWALVVMLVLQSVQMFSGESLHGEAMGTELLLLSMVVIENTLWVFSKPKRPYLKYTVFYEDGSRETYIENAESPYAINSNPKLRATNIAVSYFESDKDEVKNEQSH